MKSRVKTDKEIKHTDKGYAIFKNGKRLSIYFAIKYEAEKRINPKTSRLEESHGTI